MILNFFSCSLKTYEIQNVAQLLMAPNAPIGLLNYIRVIKVIRNVFRNFVEKRWKLGVAVDRRGRKVMKWKIEEHGDATKTGRFEVWWRSDGKREELGGFAVELHRIEVFLVTILLWWHRQALGLQVRWVDRLAFKAEAMLTLQPDYQKVT